MLTTTDALVLKIFQDSLAANPSNDAISRRLRGIRAPLSGSVRAELEALIAAEMAEGALADREARQSLLRRIRAWIPRFTLWMRTMPTP